VEPVFRSTLFVRRGSDRRAKRQIRTFAKSRLDPAAAVHCEKPRSDADNNTIDRTVPHSAGSAPRGGGGVLQDYDGRAYCKELCKGSAGAVAAVVLLLLSGHDGAAQIAANFGSDLDPLFHGLLTRPADLNNTLQYAAAVAKTDDVESAISTYEQLLFYNPTLSSLRFQLGTLYYRLGSYDMARGYFQSALTMRDIAPELRQRAQDYIAEIDRKLQPDQFSGFAQTGLRYQTNAAAGPGPGTVLASKRLFDSRFFAQGDWNWFGAFGVSYSHDFGTQDSDTFEASLLGYDAQQFRLHQFDIGLLELRAGPRFGILPDSAGGVSIKPYGIATGALLADTPYSGGAGGGLTLHATIGAVAFDPDVEIVQQGFRNSTLYPLASGMNGTLSTYALQASAPITTGLSWQSRALFAHASDVYGPDGYDSYAADIWLPWNFSPADDGRIWTLTPTAGVTSWRYGAPDPTIDAALTAHVTEWRVGLGLDVPLWKQLLLGMLVQYRADLSNVPAFAMRDFAVTAGPTVKF
jgi:hypothetical protein